MRLGRFTLKPFFEPRDLWIGAYIDPQASAVFLCVLTLGLKISWGEPAPVPLFAKQALAALDALITDLLARGPEHGLEPAQWGSMSAAMAVMAQARRLFPKFPLAVRVVAELARRGLLK